MNPVAVASVLSGAALINLIIHGEWVLAGGIIISFVLCLLPGSGAIPLALTVIVMIISVFRGAIWAAILLAGNLGVFFYWAKREREQRIRADLYPEHNLREEKVDEAIEKGATNDVGLPVSFEPHNMTTTRRKLSAILLGLFYGGSVFTGVVRGLDYVTRSADIVSQWPVVESTASLVSVVVMGLLAAYSAQSASSGMIASAIGSAVFFFLPLQPAHGQPYLCLLFFLLGVGGASYGRTLPISAEDLQAGRLFGVWWKHWLWLWVPWEYVIANAVWLGTPAVLLLRKEITALRLLSDTFKSLICVWALAYFTLKALSSIRADSPLSRLQSAGAFLLWFLVLPIVANLWRLLF